jgi:putative FmdB family regulatory protein
MPIYEYQCQACGRRHEAIQRLADPVLTVCPDCGGALKKLVSSPAFQFKGTGWYATDYANKKGPGSEGSKDSGKGEGGEQSASSSSEKNADKSSDPSSASAKSSETKSSSDSKSTEAAKTSTKKDSAKAADS